jgi:hypothetical protein
MLAGTCLGLLISAIVKSSSTVIYLILVVLFVQIIFSGALFALPEAARPLSVFTQTRWAMEGLGATVNMDGLNDLSQSYIVEIASTVPARVTFTINYIPTVGHLLGTWFVQLLFAAGFAAITGYVLKRQDVH